MHIDLLPEDVMGKILSYVPTKLAASTSILSKKWRNVFALVSNLDFDDSYVLLQPEEVIKDRESFRNFVNRTLALQCGSPIKKFSLKCYIDEDNEMKYVSPWIRNAVERSVLELVVSIKRDYESIKFSGALILPCELFRSKTLVKLTLGTRIALRYLPLDVSLPALKILFIDSIEFWEDDDLCYVLLPGCPMLEELSLRHEYLERYPYYISSRTIKKLSVYYNDSESELKFMSVMSFDAPNLVSLDYSNYALYEYPQVNLESLVEAKLDIRYSGTIARPDLTGLVIGIRNIKTLHLTPASADVIARCVKHGLVLPLFDNLVSLSFGSVNKRGWRLLPYLLKQSPKLETLIIQGLNRYSSDVTMRPFQVKVLHVLGYGTTAKELELLKSFLGGTKWLELVRVEIAQGFVVDDGVISQTHRDLMALVGVSVSTKCQIKVTYII